MDDIEIPTSDDAPEIFNLPPEEALELGLNDFMSNRTAE
jgi:hypothetical protein